MHLFGGTLFWGVFLGIFYALDVNTNWIDIGFISGGGFHGLWIVLSFMVTHFGAQLPDYDLLWDKILPHRNVITHSIGSGKESRFTVWNRTWNECGEIKKGDVIRCIKWSKSNGYYALDSYKFI